MPPHTIRLGQSTVGEDVIHRLAVRAIAEREGRVLLLRATSTGGYKFPGGGVETGEGPEEALARELDEECGRALVALGAVEVLVVETRPAVDRPGAEFRMESRYFRCEVGGVEHRPRLEEYETALGLRQEWVTPSEAIAEATRVISRGRAPAWAARERAVLSHLASSSGQPRRG